MKRWKWISGLLIAAFLLLPVLSDAAQRHYNAQVYRLDATKMGIIGSTPPSALAATGITYQVLAVGTSTEETLYSSVGFGSGVTAKTNPVTTTVFATDGGRIDFVCDPTDATSDLNVDLIVVDTVGGYTAVVHNFNPYMRAVYIDETPGIAHNSVIWFKSAVTSETLTGITFAANTFIEDVKIEVTQGNSGATMNVGTIQNGVAGNSQTGFRSGVSLTSNGMVFDTGVITAGTGANSQWAASTYGNLMGNFITGTTGSANNSGGSSLLGHYITGNKTGVMTYSVSVANNVAGFIHTVFRVLR